MKLVAASIVAFVLGISAASSALSQDLLLSELVRQTKVALLLVEQAEPDLGMSFDSAVLQAATEITKSGEAGFSFVVVSLNGEGSNSVTSTVTLTLSPPDRESPSDVSDDEIAEALAKSILAAADAIAAARDGEPPLDASLFVTEIKFGILKTADGRLEIAFPPFKIGGGGAVSSNQIQSIQVTYSKESDS